LTPWEIISSPQVARQGKDAPAALRAYMDTILDLLARDPASVAIGFDVRPSRNELVLYFPAGRGFLAYRVIEPARMVYLVALFWP
jgi:hypothetical protein